MKENDLEDKKWVYKEVNADLRLLKISANPSKAVRIGEIRE